MQAPDLAGFDAGGMRLVPVATLSDAIQALTHVGELEPGLPPERSDQHSAEEPDPAEPDVITDAVADGAPGSEANEDSDAASDTGEATGDG
jgi:hypothetical protein